MMSRAIALWVVVGFIISHQDVKLKPGVKGASFNFPVVRAAVSTLVSVLL